MYSFQVPTKIFWERLDMSVDDALEFETPKKKPWLTLFSQMEKTNGWFSVIDLPKRKKDFKTYFKHLFKNDKPNFYRLYFLSQFASKVDNVAIRERLPYEIEIKYQTKLESGECGYESMLYPIYKLNPDLLEDILYDSMINKSFMKAYEFKEKDISEFTTKLNEISIKEHFNFLKERGKLRSEFEIWWFERKNGKIKILIRTGSKRSRSIHQVSQNTFLKTAADKIMVFSEDGKRLEILSNQPIRVLKWANLMASKEMGFDVEYEPVPNQYDSKKILEFIRDVKNKKIPDVSLISIEVKNTPLVNSPTITLNSSLDSISESLDELKEQHNLELLSSIEDVNFVTFMIEENSYKILLKSENDVTEISFDNRNTRENMKNRFYEVLNSHIK